MSNPKSSNLLLVYFEKYLSLQKIASNPFCHSYTVSEDQLFLTIPFTIPLALSNSDKAGVEQGSFLGPLLFIPDNF